MIYPISLINASLGTETSPKKSLRESSQLRSLMMYCLLDMGNDEFLPLNRDYKPIGMLTRDWVEYEKYPFLFIPRDKINFDFLWDNGISWGRQSYYSYSDSTSPIHLDCFRRYRQIIKQTFLSPEKKGDIELFNRYWGYKRNVNPKDYDLNLRRFHK